MRRGVGGLLTKYFLAILILLVSLFHLDVAQSEEAKFMGEGKKGHPKIESVLLDLQEKYFVQERAVTNEFAKRHQIQTDKDGRAIVFIQPEGGKTKEAIDIETLKAYGCEIIKSGDTVVKAKVPISMLDLIADQIKGISFIKRPDRPLADVVSQGVTLTGAPFYYSSGYEGQNVKIAVIDLGFAGLSSAVAAGEVPNSVIKIDCTGTDCVNTDFSSETEDHGTAVAEIVHDMAPGAQLYLIKIEDPLDLMNAKDYCIGNGIEIINHSVAWFNTNFYDGACYFDNPVCTANHAYRNGILWVNSAGNYGKRHYEAIFQDSDGDRLHNVTSNSNYIAISANAGDPIIATLTWDAWPVTDQDYDLLLYNSSNVLVAASMNWQNGTQPPSEEIAYFVPTSGTYYLAVKKYSATSNHKFEIFSFYHDLNPYVASSSITSPSDAMGVMAVAAINQANWATGPQEDFSSQGPTTDGRIKPDMSGPDGVSNSVYGSFFGTSASSPHVAGGAALILSSNPTLSVSQLWDAITSSAIDMGLNGKDTIYGYGRLNLAPLYATINLYPNTVDFGDVLVGAISDKLVTIRNDGNANLMIGTITLPSAPYQIITDNCSGATLPFETSCTLTIRFSPTSAALFRSSLSIPSNDPNHSLATAFLNGMGIYEIALSSPLNQASFLARSSNSPPIFQWYARVPFNRYELQFSGDVTFTNIAVRLRIFGNVNGKSIGPYQWKKILLIPGQGGGIIYWRVVGTRSDGASGISDIRSMVVPPPHPVENPNLSTTSRTGLPTLTWQNNFNIKFKAWFGSDGSFSKKSVLFFNLFNANPDREAFSKALTPFQWLTIRRLVGDVSGQTIYWYVESWDSLNRYTKTGVMTFGLTD